MIYLACPYSHPDPAVREARFRAANAATADLMRRGHVVFSPISHSHPIAVQCDLPGDVDYWWPLDNAMLAASSRLIVLKLDGYETSRGIAKEVREMVDLGKPIEYMETAS